MVFFRESAIDEETKPIIEKAREIAVLATTVPDFFVIVRDILIACPRYLKRSKLEAAFKPYEKEDHNNREEAARLKELLITFYEMENKWNVPNRKGRLVEEIVSMIRPEKLGIESTECPQKREAFAVDEEERRFFDHNIDIVYDDINNKKADGIECKTQLTWWVDLLDQPNHEKAPKVRRKLETMCSLKTICNECNIKFEPWLSSLEDDLSPSEECLRKHGFSSIGLINGDLIYEAISS